MTYSDAFNRITKKELITPIGPTKDPTGYKRSKSWNKDAYSKFHRGNRHNIEDFYKLKHLTQNMVDNKTLPLPSGAKKYPTVLKISEDRDDVEDDFACKPKFKLVILNFYHLKPQF